MAAGGSSGCSKSALPVCVLVLGMAGSGKTTFVKKMVDHLNASQLEQAYVINLDPAVYRVPYNANIDIRDTVKFKEVMKQYGFGPNGAIMTSLNFFAARFDQVLHIIGKKAADRRYFVFDTPGQIEVFTWSASGMIITTSLAATYPTIVVYVMDTPRSHNPVTFMSNMLYACSVLYRMKLPFICVLNKTDIIDCEFALEWMRDFEAFQRALDMQRGNSDSGRDAGVREGMESSQYMNSLISSMALVLDEFYSGVRCCGVSSISGEGLSKFVDLVNDATSEYYKEYLPTLKTKKAATFTQMSSINPKVRNAEALANVDNVNDADDQLASRSGKHMLLDMVGMCDGAQTDPLVHLDGVESKPDEITEQPDDFQFLENSFLSESKPDR